MIEHAREDSRSTADHPLQVLYQLWNQRWVIAITVFATTAVFVAYAFFATPRYLAEVVLMPVTDTPGEGALSSLMGSMGGLAALAGVSLGGDDERRKMAIAVLKSRDYATEFIAKRNLLPVLFSDKWDSARKQWKSDDPDDIPTMDDAFRLFDREIRRLSEDQKTGIVRLGILWSDREAAAAWANEFAAGANERLRTREMNEARQSLSYVRSLMNDTEIAPLKETLAKLAESQLRREMLASVRPEFAMRVVDPAVAPDADRFRKPNRPLLLVLGPFFGLLLALIVVALRSVLRDLQTGRGVERSVA